LSQTLVAHKFLSDIVIHLSGPTILINHSPELHIIQLIISVQVLSGVTELSLNGLIENPLPGLSSWNMNLVFSSIHQAQATVLDVIVDVHILTVQYLVSFLPLLLAR
jgi:hypothetical protein